MLSQLPILIGSLPSIVRHGIKSCSTWTVLYKSRSIVLPSCRNFNGYSLRFSSTWKSSSSQKPNEIKKLDRQKLYEQFVKMDGVNLSESVRTEMPLYELTNYARYRLALVFVVAQYFFWAYCANVLYMFYKGVDEHGNKLRTLSRQNKSTEDQNTSFLSTCGEYLHGQYLFART